jgi:hypothetical protein
MYAISSLQADLKVSYVRITIQFLHPRVRCSSSLNPDLLMLFVVRLIGLGNKYLHCATKFSLTTSHNVVYMIVSGLARVNACDFTRLWMEYQQNSKC